MASSHLLPFLTLLSLSLSSLALSQRCHPNDESALLRFKRDLNNPSAFITWIPRTNCCNWEHLTCDSINNRIIDIYIFDANFHLPIPSAMGDIQFLRSITMSNCNLTGSIPRAISKLSQLDLLFLERNLLIGPVPSFLGRLKNLTLINLSQNNLTGRIPPSLSQLSLLQILRLDHNKLTGGVPQSFGDFKERNLLFQLNNNRLSGPIPTSLGSLKLFLLDVSNNRLTGDISFFFGKNKTLEAGYFSWNRFKFDFSNFEFQENLFTLNLDHNRIYGKVPEGLAETTVRFLNLSYNRLCGRIPVGGTLQDFDASTYSNNRCLCGNPLPECK